MNFQVPQFIDVEDKIFGPLSFKQFLYIMGGAGLGYIFYTFEFIPLFLRAIPIALSVGLGLALAFYKVNGQPFVGVMESGLKYYLKGKLYLWKKNDSAPVRKNPASEDLQDKSLFVPNLSESKLQDLSWSLDINDKIK